MTSSRRHPDTNVLFDDWNNVSVSRKCNALDRPCEFRASTECTDIQEVEDAVIATAGRDLWTCHPISL
jgi:hypothetical protein